MKNRLLFLGPPGSGKTMIAKSSSDSRNRLPTSKGSVKDRKTGTVAIQVTATEALASLIAPQH